MDLVHVDEIEFFEYDPLTPLLDQCLILGYFLQVMSLEVQAEVDLIYGLVRADPILRNVELDAQLVKQQFERGQQNGHEFALNTTGPYDYLLHLIVELEGRKRLLLQSRLTKHDLMESALHANFLSETKDELLSRHMSFT